ncbi:MAG: hypothetical protein ACREP0_01095 [Rhodanobacteraceae bacterium]
MQWRLPAAAFALMAVVSGTAGAHAVAGQRLFPSTLNFDDPGIGAELPMTFSSIRDDGRTVNDLGLSVTKPIAPGFSILADTDYLGATGAGMPPVHGWGNFALGAVWQVYINPNTESIGSFEINRTFQHTGSLAVRDNFSTWSPQFNFGQGLGMGHANWLRPFAISGAIGADLPDDRQIPKMLNWDLSLQYSIPYLQDFVKYAGIKAPFNNMIPIVEFPMQTCLDRGCHGQTTGYVAPGVIWIGHYYQWGVELLAPVNHRSGNSVGIMLGFDFYLDDLAPHGFGAPLFR